MYLSVSFVICKLGCACVCGGGGGGGGGGVSYLFYIFKSIDIHAFLVNGCQNILDW